MTRTRRKFWKMCKFAEDLHVVEDMEVVDVGNREKRKSSPEA